MAAATIVPIASGYLAKTGTSETLVDANVSRMNVGYFQANGSSGGETVTFKDRAGNQLAMIVTTTANQQYWIPWDGPVEGLTVTLSAATVIGYVIMDDDC